MTFGRGHRGTLGQLLVGRANSFGFLRLLLALSVVYSHSYPVGYGRNDPLWRFSGGQADVGQLAVVGFFVLSGFMITASGTRLSVGRFAWHRVLRIFPGLWACLLVTALVVAPVLYQRVHGSMAGFWTEQGGPGTHLSGAWTTAMSSGYDISGVMWSGIHQGVLHVPAFDGALWSLGYELFCYVAVGVLAAGGTLRRAPRTVVLVAVGLWASMAMNVYNAPDLRGATGEPSAPIQLPFLNALLSHYLIYLGFAFALGACAQLYRHRVPVDDRLALLAALVLLGSLRLGCFTVLGWPAFAYLILWLGLRLPAFLHGVGRKHDYSYGVYIYGFVIQQSLALYRVPRRGMPVYLSLAVLGTLVTAVLSWHLVERQALRLKDWRPAFPRVYAKAAVPLGRWGAGGRWRRRGSGPVAPAGSAERGREAADLVVVGQQAGGDGVERAGEGDQTACLLQP